MRNKQLSFGTEARNKMMEGINELGNAVKVTLGPKGRNVVIVDDMGMRPHVTKDGVTVAKSIKFADQQKNVGSQMIKEVSELTNTLAGDGTTTSTVLAQAMVYEGNKFIATGVSPMELKRGMDLALRTLLKKLPDMRYDITPENLYRITNISANSDTDVGDNVAKALNLAGSKGVITLEPANAFDSWIEERQGYVFDRGWYNSTFAETHAKGVINYMEPKFIVSNDEITDLNSIVPLLEAAAKAKKTLIIIAPDFSPEVISALSVNNSRKILLACAIKAPGYGDRRSEYLEDVAIFTGTTLLNRSKGILPSTLTLDTLGTAKSITITKTNTAIIDGASDAETIAARIESLETEIADETTHPFQRDRLKERITSLAGIAVTIRMGAVSEIVLKEKKDRFDDAIAAGRAALEEGVVPGGGVTLIRLAKELEGLTGNNNEQNIGIGVIREALKVPFYQILRNAGIEPARYHIEEFTDVQGVDASTGEIVNMLESGIIDPAKVTRVALENSISVAGVILTTEAIVYLDPKETISGYGEHLMK